MNFIFFLNSYSRISYNLLFIFYISGDDSGKYIAPARRQPQGNVAPNNRNTQPQNQQANRHQQVSPASSMSRGRRDYPGQGNSPAGGGQASAHSGRDQQYHDDHVRGSGGPRGGRGGGNFNREPNRGPGGRPDKVASELRQFGKDFVLDQNQQRGGAGGHPYEKQPSPKLASPSAGGPNQQGPGARGSPGQKGSSPPTAAEVAGQQRRTSPPTASIITRQDSAEQRRTPTPAKSPPMATPTVATPMPPTGVPTGVPVSIPPVPAAATGK